MPPTVLLDLTGPAEAGWRAAVVRSAPHLGESPVGRNLVQCSEFGAPELVICLAPAPGAALDAALESAFAVAPSCPVLLLTPPVADLGADADAAAARVVAAGVHHWVAIAAEGVTPAVLAQARSLALARGRHERALRDTLARTQAQLDERKWVERAKGVLMSARGMDEDAAFRLLRGAAMNVNLRVGELARAVFESAQWADAMNRAGQLRMLSQRCVRLVAQRMLRIDVRGAVVLQAQTAQRVRDNLDVLAQLCTGTGAEPAQREAARCWERLHGALVALRATGDEGAALLALDRDAGALLAAAETLTEALQQVAGRRALAIVNQCGRQRLRVQRVAKDSLLAALHAAPGDGEAFVRRRDLALGEFEQALRELEAAPLSSPEIRATLAQVHDEWLRLLAGLRTADRADGRRALVHASETMLERLDTLTAAYEHSLQVIMG